ncbi:MAG: hypothetical protein ACHQ4J_11900 [Candidatus Binatia bacterium]
MQRDLLVAFWFLFDEFEVGEPDVASATGGSAVQEPPKNGSDAEKAKPRVNGAARQRRNP